MNVLSINGSFRRERGNTALILKPFLAGLEWSGATVERLDVHDLRIHPCEEEYACWYQTPGQCFLSDDMRWVLPKMMAATLWVIASPLFSVGFPGPLVTLFDRMLPATLPSLELQDRHSRIGFRQVKPEGKIALVASCTYWERDTFDLMIKMIQSVAVTVQREFVGALLRPGSAALYPMFESKNPPQDIVEAAHQAGVELGQTGRIRETILQAVSRNLMPRAEYIRFFNEGSLE